MINYKKRVMLIGYKMPLCGFDKQMLDGLSMFYEGLAEAVIRKSKANEITMVQAIETEIKEMNEFVDELSGLHDVLARQKLIGITNYAQSFYQEILKRNEHSKRDIRQIMEEIIKETRNFLFMVDKMYEEHFRQKSSPMKELVSWINKDKSNIKV